MKLLLDTHVLIWWLTDPDLIKPESSRFIKDPASIVFVSVGAIWEISIKKTLGRLRTPDNLLQVLEQERIQILPIEAAHALEVANLPLIHHDPFDRIQIAQARLEQLTFVTRDETIKKYSVSVVEA